MLKLGRYGESIALVVWSLTLGIGYAFDPLYKSNQNHKFLVGLARAGLGCLDHDWLVGTSDPVPLFSLLVEVTYRVAGDWPFYLGYLLLMVPYLAGLISLFGSLGPGRGEPPRLAFVAAILVLHSDLLGDLSRAIAGLDVRRVLIDGVAQQSLVDHYLQPSLLGVFLVLSVARFAQGKLGEASAFAAVPAALHFTYFLTAITLVATYLAIAIREDRGVTKRVMAPALLYSAITAPTLLYTAVTFAPTTPEAFCLAQHTLATVRIPYHCNPAIWFDRAAAARLLWVGLALGLVRGTKLFAVLAVSLSATIVLTVVQVATGSDALALLFPWRASTVLVPIATAIIVSGVVWRVAPTGPSRGPRCAGVTSLAAVLVIAQVGLYGAGSTRDRFRNRARPSFTAMIDHVRSHARQCYMFVVPIDSSRGEAQKFRLESGLPVYADFKSHPYKDTEVLEWFRRITLCRKVYVELRRYGRIGQESAAVLRAAGVTHLLLDGSVSVLDDGLHVEYRNLDYAIIRLTEVDDQSARFAGLGAGRRRENTP